MNLHEYQSKQLLADIGIAIPAGESADSVEHALDAAERLGGNVWVVKAQIHAGGRGKAGGVRKVEGRAALEVAARAQLASPLVTHQTGPTGQPVERLLIERPVTIARELYCACLLDRAHETLVVLLSAEGGMDIEEVAATAPEKILRYEVRPGVGLMPYQMRDAGFALGLDEAGRRALASMVDAIVRLYTTRDLQLLEINPLVVTDEGALIALDAKIQVDDNALFRHKDLAALEDPAQLDGKEIEARKHDLNYIALDGDIGCMVNGAGLAMATMDLIQLHGGSPANFLDVGGGTTAARVAEAFKILVHDPKVRAILVNIFGGIVRCDLIAEGIIQAVREVGVRVPVVVRLEGTNADGGRAKIRESGLAIIAPESLTDAAERAVAAARGAS